MFPKLFQFFKRSQVNDAFFTDLEETLIGADVGHAIASRLVDSVRRLKTADEVKQALAREMTAIFPAMPQVPEIKPIVTLILGVNGTGKTTTIAKLAHSFKRQGKRVLLVAADTFRAAAVEQLKIWGDRLELEVVSQGPGADAAAVAFDGVQKAIAKSYDAVLIDTAGRLHTKHNLMEELKKIARVIGRAFPGAPHEKLLVLDATVGSNGLAQARKFHEAVGLTGVIVTKLDGTAKGGIVLAIAGEMGIPVTHIGVGEGLDDLQPFDAREFVEGVFEA